MKRWGLIVGVAMSAAFSVFGVASASAATEFGDPCIANRGTSESEATIIGISSISSPLPSAAPSAGVITSWKINLITPPPPSKPIPAIIPETLKVLRLNTTARTAQVMGEASGLVGSGINTFPARIPVQPGDRLGLFGHGKITVEGVSNEVGTLYCEGEGASGVIGVFEGNILPGASAAYEEGSGEIDMPAVAVIEPDADNDGYGDETQDKCSTSAATHDACPAPAPPPAVISPVTLSASATTKQGSAKILVTTGSQTSVTVLGTVKLGKHETVKLHGGTQLVSPGTLANFTLLFPKALKEKLKALSPKQSLTLVVTTTAPNSAGAVTTNELKVKLKGQAKPVNRKGKGKRG